MFSSPSRRRRIARRLACLLATLFIPTTASLVCAAAFTPGDLVIARVGDGTSTLTSVGNAVYLDEYTTYGTLIQSIPMPTAVSGSNKPFFLTGTSTSEGMLTLSPDKQTLALGGFASTATGLSGTTAAAVNRVMASIGMDGSIDTSTALSSGLTGDLRSVVRSGNQYWIGTSTSGVQTAAVGATGSGTVSTTVSNTRNVNIFGGQLYVSDSSGSAVRLGAVGSGLPTTSGTTTTNLPGFATSGSPYAYQFLDLSSSVAGLDTLYVADDTSGTGGIQKWSLDSGSWVLKGTIVASGVRGLTAQIDEHGTVNLFGTTGASSAGGGGSIFAFQDLSGYDAFPGGTPTALTIASLSGTSDEAFRGIAYVPEPSTIGALAFVGSTLLMRRRPRSGRTPR